MKLLGLDALLRQLAAHAGTPFHHLPPSALPTLDGILRVFELHQGDQLVLGLRKGQGAYVSVLAGTGEARLGNGTVLALQAGRTELVTPRADETFTVNGKDLLFCVADAEAIDDLVSLDTLTAEMDSTRRHTLQLLERARQSPAFRRVPLECVEQALDRMAHETVTTGTEVILQGEPGELFYVIAHGRAEVWQTGLYDDAAQLVAELGPGDAFGEEALVTNSTRSATVRMITDGELLTLGKEDYQALISQQMVDEVGPAVAKTMLDEGYKLLDVRYAEEHEDSHIPDSQLIPLPELRTRMAELDRGRRWVVYCRSGRRSAVAALLLRQAGIAAVSLAGGINAWPHEIRQAA